MRKILSILFMAIGVILLMLPFITDGIIRYYSKNSSIEGITYDDIEANNEREAVFDYSAVEDVDIASVISGALEFNLDFMVGIIEIPDLDINIPILKGINKANLTAGAATMKPEQIMGQGNYPLAGHNMRNKDLLFGRLMDIEIGSTIILTDKNIVYEYRVYDTQVVPDTATDMLSEEKSEERGKPIVSLMTCYHSSKTGKRFFALGELIDEYPVSEGK